MKRSTVISIAATTVVAAGAVASCTVDNPEYHRGCPDGMIADGMDCIPDPDAQGGHGGSGDSPQGGNAGTLSGGAAGGGAGAPPGGGSAGKGDGGAGGATSVTIETTTVPAARFNMDYEVQLDASFGGSGDIVWTLSDGELPEGLTLAEDGTLAGRPSEDGEFSFTVTAATSSSSDTQELHLVVERRSWIAFSGDIDTLGVQEVYVMDLADPTRLRTKISQDYTNPDGDSRGPTALWFSPDGQRIAFAMDQQERNHYSLFASELSNSGFTQAVKLTPEGLDVSDVNGNLHDLVWSPSGTRLAFVAHDEADEYAVYSIDFDDTLVAIDQVEGINTEEPTDIGWVGDDRLLVINSEHEVLLSTFSGGEPSRFAHVTLPETSYYRLYTTPERECACAMTDSASTTNTVTCLDFASGEAPYSIGTDIRPPLFSNDLQRMAYIKISDWDITVRPVAADASADLELNPSSNQFTLSGDGRYLAWRDNEMVQLADVVNGTQETVEPVVDLDIHLRFSPGATWLAHYTTSEAPVDIIKLVPTDLDQGPPESLLVVDSIAEPGAIQSVSFAPNDEALSFHTSTFGYYVDVSSGSPSEPLRVADSHSIALWAHDSSFFLVRVQQADPFRKHLVYVDTLAATPSPGLLVAPHCEDEAEACRGVQLIAVQP